MCDICKIMKKVVFAFILLLYTVSVCGITGNDGAKHLFATSKCFDMLASLQYFDKIKGEPQFRHLASDTVFMRHLSRVANNVAASKLCNFYATFKGDKDNADSCVRFFVELPNNEAVAQSDARWISDIAKLQPEIAGCLSAVNDAGYSDYWEAKVRPAIDNRIKSYPVSDSILTIIHSVMAEFSGSDGLPETRSSIYVLNIDNAFNLSDESFCCTPLLLDREMEKRYRLDFLKVYIHENLHRLSVSDSLMKKLDDLKADEFYRDNEKVAAAHGEGLNEAFVVAAEVFISQMIGRRDNKSVYDEFREYVDGSLVLAPVIFVHLSGKKKDESLNDFILRLFDEGIISVGKVRSEYDNAMMQLKANL